MSPRTGRPKIDNPKSDQIKIRATKQDKDLLDKCYKVLTGSIMMIGQVKNGQQYVDGKWVDCMEPGKVIINPEVAEELLPSRGGFFFGSTEYDEYYMQDIEDTIEIIKNVLATTDFETQMLAYCSSW